jgi:hypothetical protein
MPGQKEGVPVTMRALTQRINRKLAERGEKLIKARGATARAEVGDWYVLDTNRSALVLLRVNPEALGRKLGILEAWERVVEG